MTLACEDANLNLVEVVTVADVDDEDHIGISLLQILKLCFGHKTKLLFKFLFDVTLACEDTNLKLFDVVTVADVDDEDSVANSLLQISKLRFGQKAKLLFRL